MSEHPHSPVYSDEPTFYQAHEWGDKWRTDVLSAVDWLGNIFRLGEKVMYCIGAGRGQMMAIGTVKQIRTRQYEANRWDQESKSYYKVSMVEIEVQVLTERTSGHWDNEKRSKPAWVNPMNVTSLNNLIESAKGSN